MSRVSTGLAVGIPAGAALFAWTVVHDLTGREDPVAPSRTVPRQRPPLLGPHPASQLRHPAR